MSRIKQYTPEQLAFLRFLLRYDAYYERPATGGPIVGYAGQYQADPKNLLSKRGHFVGEVYYNIPKVEEHPRALRELSRRLSMLVRDAYPEPFDNFGAGVVALGMPLGGLSVANQLAEELHLCRYAFAEKKVTKAATDDGQREQSVLVMGRHYLYPGERVFVVEDVCNNFTTTQAALHLIEEAGAILEAIICVVNREEHGTTTWEGHPVISLCQIPTEQYRQDDPAVAEDVANGNVIWKPKPYENWAPLAQLMRDNPPAWAAAA